MPVVPERLFENRFLEGLRPRRERLFPLAHLDAHEPILLLEPRDEVGRIPGVIGHHAHVVALAPRVQVGAHGFIVDRRPRRRGDDAAARPLVIRHTVTRDTHEYALVRHKKPRHDVKSAALVVGNTATAAVKSVVVDKSSPT